MSEDGEQPEESTRGEEILAEIRRKHVVPGQFRLGALMMTILVVSVILTIPRLIGSPYEEFFLALRMLVYIFAPLCGLSANLLLPSLRTRTRFILAAVCTLLFAMPALGYAIWKAAGDGAQEFVQVVTLLFWLPQILCIGGVWYFLFRKS